MRILAVYGLSETIHFGCNLLFLPSAESISRADGDSTSWFLFRYFVQQTVFLTIKHLALFL